MDFEFSSTPLPAISEVMSSLCCSDVMVFVTIGVAKERAYACVNRWLIEANKTLLIAAEN